MSGTKYGKKRIQDSVAVAPRAWLNISRKCGECQKLPELRQFVFIHIMNSHMELLYNSLKLKNFKNKKKLFDVLSKYV